LVFETKEAISVSAVFKDFQLRPTAFIWNSRKHKIIAILGSFRSRKGKFCCYHYAVKVQDGDIYEIYLSTEDMSWNLVRVHSRGDL
jgi:hypothetical protein